MTQRPDSQTQAWAFSFDSASPGFSLASGCGSAASLWLLAFSTVSGLWKQPLLGGGGGSWALRICSAGGHTPAVKAAGLELTSPVP